LPLLPQQARFHLLDALRPLQALLDAGAAVDSQLPGGDTPLHCAVDQEDLEMVEMLLRR
jgi:ankyrin repeat protein